jgi:hypothetical protein
MPNFLNKERAMAYFRQHKKYTEYRGSPKLQEIYDKKFQDLIKTGTVEKTTFMDKPFPPDTKSERGYETGDRHEKGQPVYEADKVQNGRSDNIKTTVGAVRLRNIVQPKRRTQSCPSARIITSAPEGSLPWRIVPICGDAVWPQRCPSGIFYDNESSNKEYKRNMEYKGSSIFGRSYSSTSRSISLKRSGQRSSPISKVVGMDSKSREVSLNPVEDVEIFRLGVGLHNIIGPFTGREKEKSVKFTKRSAEKASSKSMDNE